jgi:hypothetical protein
MINLKVLGAAALLAVAPALASSVADARPGGGFSRGGGGGVAAFRGGGGLALGALGSSYYYSDPYYYDDTYAYVDDGQYAAAPASDSDAAYCAQRYRSYDPASGTYLNYDGNRYPCP